MSKSVMICPFVLTQYRYWMDRPTGQTYRIGKTISWSACTAWQTVQLYETSQLDNTQCLLPHSQTQCILT